MEKIIYRHFGNNPIEIDKLEKYNGIEFADEYNQPVDNLPINIKFLFFGIDFNQSLDNLPSGIEKIYFANNSKFSQPVDFLPAGLKEIRFGYNYNIPLDNLPVSLEKLLVPYFYKHSMVNFPTNLKKILIPIRLPNPTWGRHWREVSDRYEKISQFYSC